MRTEHQGGRGERDREYKGRQTKEFIFERSKILPFTYTVLYSLQENLIPSGRLVEEMYLRDNKRHLLRDR